MIKQSALLLQSFRGQYLIRSLFQIDFQFRPELKVSHILFLHCWIIQYRAIYDQWHFLFSSSLTMGLHHLILDVESRKWYTAVKLWIAVLGQKMTLMNIYTMTWNLPSIFNFNWLSVYGDDIMMRNDAVIIDFFEHAPKWSIAMLLNPH